MRSRGYGAAAARSRPRGPDGKVVRLAGPGCPTAFHVAPLREMESHWRWPDARWVVIISGEVSADGARWVSTRLDELADISVGDG